MDGELRLLLSEDEADAERIDALTGFLRADLLELDVDDVTALRAGEAPPGSKALDVLATGGLLVTLSRSAQSLAAVIGVVRDWLARGRGPRRTVRIEMGGDVLELSEVTAADQDRLVALFVGRHAPEEGDGWKASGKP